MKSLKNIWANVKLRPILIIVPLFVTILLIVTYAVNVPFQDEWELVPIFQHLHAGHFLWSDIWRQHNEHRIPFPILVLIGLSYITHWNILVECFAGLAVAAGSFFLITKVIAQSGAVSTTLLFLLALIWFSPVQVDNWLWGWQLEWFMNVFGVSLVVFALSRTIKARQLSNGDLALILGGGILAQYSLGSGTLLWPIIVLVLLYLKVRRSAIFLTAFAGSLTTFLFYFHYANTLEPSKRLAFHEPVQFVEYFFSYLGRPLSFMHSTAILFGTLLLMAFLIFYTYIFLQHKALFNKTLPWFVLGLYAIGSALTTGLARLGLGLNQAYSSRYTTISSLLLISVIMTFWQSRKVIKQLSHNFYSWLKPVVVVGLFSLVLAEAAWGIHSANEQHAKLEAIKHCTQVQTPSSRCLLLTYPNPTIAASRLQYVKSIHWAGY